MSSYLQRLFNRAAAAPTPALPVASPANRIGSPIAERDQRLNLPEFGDAVITADVWPEPPAPPELLEPPPPPALRTVTREVRETRIVDLFPRAAPPDPQHETERPRPAAQPAVEPSRTEARIEPVVPDFAEQADRAPRPRPATDQSPALEPAKAAPALEPPPVRRQAAPAETRVARAEPARRPSESAPELFVRPQAVPRTAPAPEQDVRVVRERGEPAIAVPEPERARRPEAERRRADPEPQRSPPPAPQPATPAARFEPRPEIRGPTPGSPRETPAEEPKAQTPPAPRPLTAEAASTIGPLPVRRRTPAIFGMRRR